MLHYRWRCGNKNIENIKYKFSIRTISFCALTFSYDDIYFFFYHFYKLCASCSTVQMYAHIKLCTFICQQQFYALKCMISFGMQREWRAKKKSTTSWFNTIGILHGFAFEMFLHEIKILHNGWNCVFFKRRRRSEKKTFETRKKHHKSLTYFSHRLFDFDNDTQIEFERHESSFFYLLKFKSNILLFIDSNERMKLCTKWHSVKFSIFWFWFWIVNFKSELVLYVNVQYISIKPHISVTIVWFHMEVFCNNTFQRMLHHSIYIATKINMISSFWMKQIFQINQYILINILLYGYKLNIEFAQWISI